MSNPVNIDTLIDKIRQEAAKKQTVSQYQPPANLDAANRIRSNNIEALLNAASAKSQIRTELPAKLKRFPWSLGGALGKISLKTYSFLFKEQRAVNFSLNQALRETLLLNQSLVKKISDLQTEISNLQARIDALEDKE
jgi:O-antigen chain-terminating methyltransferase